MSIASSMAGCACLVIGLAVNSLYADEPSEGSTTQSTSVVSYTEVSVPEHSYSLFYDQGAHLKDLIKAGQYEHAAALYRKYQSSFFNSRREKYASVLDDLAGRVTTHA